MFFFPLFLFFFSKPALLSYEEVVHIETTQRLLREDILKISLIEVARKERSQFSTTVETLKILAKFECGLLVFKSPQTSFEYFVTMVMIRTLFEMG